MRKFRKKGECFAKKNTAKISLKNPELLKKCKILAKIHENNNFSEITKRIFREMQNFREISLCFSIFRFFHSREKMRNFAIKFAKYEPNFRIFSRNFSFAGNPRKE